MVGRDEVLHHSNIKHVDKVDIPKYFRKALQFSKSMHSSFSDGNWDATGLAAVHMAISINDALTASRISRCILIRFSSLPPYSSSRLL